MPRGDRTGPWGMGPLTGRRAGYCVDYDVPGYANPLPGRGYGRGWGTHDIPWGYGRGGGERGWRHHFYTTGQPRWARPLYAPVPAWNVPSAPTKEQELEWLKQQADWLKDQLDAISQRISDLDEE